MILKAYWEVGLDWDAKLKSHDMKYRSRDLEMDNGECYQRCDIEKKNNYFLVSADSGRYWV